jgi:hypothetical protein
MNDVIDDGFGYDPTTREPLDPIVVGGATTVPVRAAVDPTLLPPVGQQGTDRAPGSPGSCAAWSSVYGLATFAAARAGKVDPASATGCASPAEIFVQALQLEGATSATCAGSRFGSYFALLAAGTPALSSAPYEPNCAWLWNQYCTAPVPPDSRFTLTGVACVATDDLDSIKQVIAAGGAMAYGTRLYTDWVGYIGVQVPYVGNGTIMYGKNGRPAGHCMLIIGYDDDLGAVLLQNSQGVAWGSKGYVWMAYDTFQALAQGQAFFVPG